MTSVLFVRLSAMGDLVQGLGAIAAVHAARPDWRLTVATQETFAPLLENLPAVHRVVTFARRGGPAAMWRLRTAMRRESTDVAIDLQGNWKSAFVTRLSGARMTLGAAGAARREPTSRWLLRRTVAVGGVPHPARVAWRLVQEIVPAAPFTWPRLVATERELHDEAASLRREGVGLDETTRVLVVTDPRDPRALRPDRIATEVRQAPGRVLILLGPGDAGLELPREARVIRHGPGQLRRLVALGALLGAARSTVIGPDQGASHVLAAAGARCRVLFGAQDPARTAPPSVSAWWHPKGPACRPCRSRSCGHAQGVVCMDFGSADGVAAPIGLPAEGATADVSA